MTDTGTLEAVEPTALVLKWTTSRGVETYGWNVCTVRDFNTGKAYRCKGGGYDMTGTVLGEWLEATYPARIAALAPRCASTYDGNGNGYQLNPGGDLYGATAFHDGRVILDGAAGVESMLKVAAAAGLKLTRTYVERGRNRGETTGWIVSALDGGQA